MLLYIQKYAYIVLYCVISSYRGSMSPYIALYNVIWDLIWHYVEVLSPT